MNLKNYRDYRDFTALINKNNLPLANTVGTNTPKTMQAFIVLASLTILTLFVTACPSSSSGGSGGAADSTAPAVVTDLAGTVSAYTTVTLTWTDPTDADFSNLLISWVPAGPTGSTMQPLSVNKGTQTATVTGLAQATPYSFTAISVDATGNQSVASTARTASMITTERLRPVALFSAGQEDGDFGLGSSGRCQTRLDDGTFAIGAELKSRGYTKAVFFGSTPDYNFIDLATDSDALGISGQSGPMALEARGLSLFALSSTSAVTETTMFGASGSEVARTVGNLVNVDNHGGAWQNGGAEIITAAVGTVALLVFGLFQRRILSMAIVLGTVVPVRQATGMVYVR